MTHPHVFGIALLIACAGCTGTMKRVATPLSPLSGAMVVCPHEVDYELLGQTSGKACAAPAIIEADAGGSHRAESRDPDAVGDAFLFELAKSDAISKVPDADNLVEARSKVEFTEQGECITVVGRAYRVTGLRAVCVGSAKVGAPSATSASGPANTDAAKR